jgi:hypothetical protein
MKTSAIVVSKFVSAVEKIKSPAKSLGMVKRPSVVPRPSKNAISGVVSKGGKLSAVVPKKSKSPKNASKSASLGSVGKMNQSSKFSVCRGMRELFARPAKIIIFNIFVKLTL